MLDKIKNYFLSSSESNSNSVDSNNKMFVEEEKINEADKLVEIKVIENVEKEVPVNLAELKELANKAFEKKDFEHAEQYYRKIVYLDKQDVGSRMKLALLYKEQKLFLPAEKELVRIINIQPKNVEAFYFLALIYNEQNQKEHAIQSLEKALKIESNNTKIKRTLKNIILEIEDSEIVIGFYLKMLKITL